MREQISQLTSSDEVDKLQSLERAQKLKNEQIEKDQCNAMNLALYEMKKCISLLNTVSLSVVDSLQDNARQQDTIDDKEAQIHYDVYTAGTHQVDNSTISGKFESASNLFGNLLSGIFGWLPTNGHWMAGWNNIAQPYQTHTDLYQGIYHEVQLNQTNADCAKDMYSASLDCLRQEASIDTAQASTISSFDSQDTQNISSILDLLGALSKTICRG